MLAACSDTQALTARPQPTGGTNRHARSPGAADWEAHSAERETTAPWGAVVHGSGAGLGLLDLDLDVDAGGEVEALEAVDRLGRGLEDVEQALVDPHLEVLAGVLVLVR